MIEGNYLKFGYGDIAIGSRPILGEISFQPLKPPMPCGSRVKEKDIDPVGEELKLSMNVEECIELTRLVSEVKHSNALIFDFKGLTFDFTNYNAASVKSIEGKVQGIFIANMLTYAC